MARAFFFFFLKYREEVAKDQFEWKERFMEKKRENEENIILFKGLSRVDNITITRTRILSTARRKAKVQDETVQN
jgi:hypothetical protein